MSDWTQEEMFPVPDVYRPKRKPPDPNVVKWTKYSGKRMSCDLCILNIHNGVREFGLALASRVAAKGDRKYHLCTRHTLQVKQGERKLS